MPRIIFTGDRGWGCQGIAVKVMARLVRRYGRDNIIVVHGGCSRDGKPRLDSVDWTFHYAAKSFGVRTEVHEADWNRHGNSAGPIRNQEMVDLKADFGVAVHRNIARSRGTKDCARRMRAAGIPVYLIKSESCELERI